MEAGTKCGMITNSTGKCKSTNETNSALRHNS
jgi:hypothetical protein